MRQRRELSAAKALLGEAASVRAYATGRANARWSPGARWMTGCFAAVFLLFLLVFHVILFPGGIALYALYGMVNPRRGVAITGSGVVELELSIWNGRPSAVMATTDHGGLFDPRTLADKNKTMVRFGEEVVSLRSGDLAMLRNGVATIPLAVAGRGSAEFPPPPSVQVFAVPGDAGDRLPRWREATVLWVLAHLAIGSAMFLGVMMGAFLVSDVLQRDTTNSSPAAGAIWLSLVATLTGWLCFVFTRSPRQKRVLLLGCLVGAALVVASVAVFQGSPVYP
jgi:hypothetical protein